MPVETALTCIEMGVSQLAEGFRSGRIALAGYLEQLEAVFNEREPSVLAFVPEAGRFDRLRRQAGDLAARFPSPDSRPPLFGVPVGVKDIFHVSGFVTRAGSQLPVDELQGPEAGSITRLRNAGALIMGKTVTTEFAYFGPGPTRNPHHAGHTPGGSSSGSAAAVGAGLCPLTVGTQTIGSVIRPASFCGCVGYKPTYERISRAGVIPLSPTFDHVGLFASDVAGAELAAGVLVEGWRTESAAGRQPVLGIPEGPYLERASADMLAHFRGVCTALARVGYTIKSVNVMPDFAEIRERHYEITAGEAARVHANWFPKYRGLYHFKTVELLERGQGVSDAQLAGGRAACAALRTNLLSTMKHEGIDLWITPSAVGPAPEGLESTGDPVMNLPWSQAGFPALNLPSGRAANGLPLGLQLVAAFNDDEALFAWGKQIEHDIHSE